MVVVGFVFCQTKSFAQSVLSGYIKNRSGKAISFATVKLKPDSLSPVGFRFCIANDKGYYTITSPAAMQKGFLEITSVGYKPVIAGLSFLPGQDIEKNIVLEADSSALPEIVIKAEAPISISGDTISFKAEAFTRGDEGNLKQLLSNMPGFIIHENGMITFNGKPITRVLIEKDDLSGQNYQGIVQNLSARGIEKIQVIKNYADPENIAAAVTGSTEQVLNIQFQKKFLHHLLGHGELNGGYPLSRYEAAGQILSLFSKVKTVSFLNGNTTGKTIQSEINDFSRPETDGSEDISDIGLPSHRPLAGISGISIAAVQQIPIYENNSYQANNHYKIKPSKKLIIKGISSISKDHYRQRLHTNQIIFSFPQSFPLSEEKNISKSGFSFDQVLSGNYLINNRHQIALVFKALYKKDNDASDRQVQNNFTGEKLKGQEKQIAWKLTYNRILKKSRVFTIFLQQLNSALPYLYRQEPPNFEGVLFNGANYQNLYQPESQNFNSYSGSASFSQARAKHSASVWLTGAMHKSKLKNRLEFLNSTGMKRIINPDSTNNLQYCNNEIVIKYQHIWKPASSLSLTFGLSGIYLDQKLSEFSRAVKFSHLKKLFLLPDISFNVKLSSHTRLFASYHAQRIGSSAGNMAAGYIIQGLSSITKGYDSLQAATSSSLNLSLSHFDLTNKGIMLFGGINFHDNPVLYLNNQYPTLYYAFSELTPVRKAAKVITGFSHGEKFFFNSHSRIGYELSWSKGKLYTMLQSRLLQTQFTHLKAGLFLTTHIKTLRIITRAKYTIATQTLLRNASESYRSKQLESDAELNWKITPRIFAASDLQYACIFPPGLESRHFLNLNARLLIKSKSDKIEWGIKAFNITAQDNYSFSTVNSNQTSVIQYDLMPRIFLAFMRFKF